MKIPTQKKTAFDVDLTDEARQELTHFICEQIQLAYDARAGVIQPGGDLDYYWALYEAARTRIASDSPYHGAADLTSFLGAEKVDALKARIMRTVFVEPVYIVEGWGDSAQKAPLVEEFHQWKVEEERLQTYIGKAVLNALVEGTGVLEVSERTDVRKVREQKRLKVQRHPDGHVILGADSQPIPDRDEQGNFIEAGDQDAFTDAIVDRLMRSNGGPQYRVLSLRDFLILPGHAQDKQEVFAYAKRFWRRVPDLQAKATQGIYDAAAIARLGEAGERQDDQARLLRSHQTIASQVGKTAEKELWEVPLLYDLDNDGIEEWYVATVSLKHFEMLRLRHDDLGQPRHVLFTPIPRSDTIYGYSLIGHKLLTILEEHTAWRNMCADRAALATNAPIKRVQGALWDADTQPWGPRAVIDVRDPNEIQPMVVPDIPAGALNREQSVIQAAQRITGESDIASGLQPQESRTLGETQLVAQQSFVRMDELIRYVQESMEDLGALRHLLYLRQLSAPESDGMPAPESVMRALSVKGQQLPDGKFLADMLRGQFRFKPRGSTDTADLVSLRGDFNGFLTAVATLTKMNPAFLQFLSTPEAVKALWEQCLRVYRFPDRQAFLGSAYQQIVQQMQQQASQPPTQTPGAQPGQPTQAGAPPPGQPPTQTGFGPPQIPVNQLLQMIHGAPAALGMGGAPPGMPPMPPGAGSMQ